MNVTQAFTTALLHLVWQGVLVALLLWLVLFLLRKSSANARYVAACCALAVVSVLPVVTSGVVLETASGIQAGSGTELAISQSSGSRGVCDMKVRHQATRVSQ